MIVFLAGLTIITAPQLTQLKASRETSFLQSGQFIKLEVFLISLLLIGFFFLIKALENKNIIVTTNPKKIMRTIIIWEFILN